MDGAPIDTSALANLAYTDIGNVRNAVGSGPGAVRRAAEQFEAIFIDMLMKSMREANAVFAEGSYLSSNEVKLQQEMLDHQWAVHLAENGGLGLADVIARQLGEEPAATQVSLPMQVNRASPAPATARGGNRQPMFSDAREFVDALMPLARRALAATPISPLAVVAQAALETGWGRHVIHDARGQSSHNLFGIKASGSWDGEAVRLSTLEVRDGVPRREMHAFRSYATFAASLNDYVELLTESPRYSDALRDGADPMQFGAALEEAGYATDPHYADKIGSLVETVRQLIGGE